MQSRSPYRVTFVCSGNICRSPIAEVVLAHAVAEAGLAGEVVVDSAGTGDWHVGAGADARAVQALHEVGLDGTAHRARLFDPTSFAGTDLVIALDAGHHEQLSAWVRTPADAGRIHLLRSFDPGAGQDLDVADPFYGSEDDFVRVVEQIRGAVPGLLQRIRADLAGDHIQADHARAALEADHPPGPTAP